MMKIIVDSTKRNKHRVFLEKETKRILIKEFKTLEQAIDFTIKIGGKWNNDFKKGDFNNEIYRADQRQS